MAGNRTMQVARFAFGERRMGQSAVWSDFAGTTPALTAPQENAGVTNADAGTKASTRLRVARLDGLRGLAVLSVVAFHAETHLGLVARPGNGLIGVAVFFVLSGYLITHIVWNSDDGASWSGYLTFLRRRFRRLAPALIAFVVIWATVSMVVGGDSIGNVLRSAALVLTQTSAYYWAVGGHGNEGWGPTWSLSVEWCFYIVWPLVIWQLRRRGASALNVSRVATGLGVVLYAVALPLNEVHFYFLPLANISVLLWGGALALRHIRRSEGVNPSPAGRDPGVVLLGIAVLLTLAIAPGMSQSAYRWFVLPAAVLGALVVVDARIDARGLADRFLELRLLRAVGLRAYSIYLWHVPVMVLLLQVLPGFSPYVLGIVSLLVLTPVVVASFELLERPCLSGRGRGTGSSSGQLGRRVSPAYSPRVKQDRGHVQGEQIRVIGGVNG
jgi:peptidoglycan/LPS O-acetylase OafA/YrhL